MAGNTYAEQGYEYMVPTGEEVWGGGEEEIRGFIEGEFVRTDLHTSFCTMNGTPTLVIQLSEMGINSETKKKLMDNVRHLGRYVVMNTTLTTVFDIIVYKPVGPGKIDAVVTGKMPKPKG